MWGIRLLDRKNGIKLYASNGFNRTIFVSDISRSILFDTREKARNHLSGEKSFYWGLWAQRQRDGITATVVKLQITEAS